MPWSTAFSRYPLHLPWRTKAIFNPHAYTYPLYRLFACLTAIFSLLEAARLGTPLHRAIYHSAPFSSLFSAIPFGAGFATPQRNHRSIASYLPQLLPKLLPTFRNSQFHKKKDCVDITLRNLLESGSVLFSRAVSSQVLSALRGLTSVFGMGTGGSLSLLPPEILFPFLPSSFPENCTDPFPLRFPSLRFRLTFSFHFRSFRFLHTLLQASFPSFP